MKTIFRWTFRLLWLLLLLLVLTIVFLDNIVRYALENQIRNSTGMEARIGSVNIGLWSPEVTIENFKIYNTAEFGGSPFIDLPELHVEYERGSLFSRKFHCALVRFNLAEVNLVQNKKGVTNLQRLQASDTKVKSPGHKSAGSSTPLIKFTGIDTLNITVGKVNTLSMNSPRKVKQLDFNIHNQILPDIKNSQDLQIRVGLLLLQNGALGLSDFFSPPGPGTMLKAAGQSVSDGVKGVLDDAKGVFKK